MHYRSESPPKPPTSLAIETSTRTGSITVGRGDDMLETMDLVQPRRHNVELMPAIAQLCDPNHLEEIYVNIGPGSFTGLRIAVTVVKMLAMVRGTIRGAGGTGVKIVAVEAVDVLAATQPTFEHLAVCVNAKRDTVYARLYTHRKPMADARIMTIDELLSTAPRPMTILGDPLPAFDVPDGVTVLPASLVRPRSDILWTLAHSRAKQNEYTDPATLLPQYARPPEAVTLWDQRHGPHETSPAK